jgi:hypothetical protein
MKTFIIASMLFFVSIFSCASTDMVAQQESKIKKHRDRLVYLVNSTAQQAGAYVVSIMWSPAPSERVDFATVTLVYPNSSNEVYVFIRDGDSWELK